jgi:hypothetical protein
MAGIRVLGIDHQAAGYFGSTLDRSAEALRHPKPAALKTGRNQNRRAQNQCT